MEQRSEIDPVGLQIGDARQGLICKRDAIVRRGSSDSEMRMPFAVDFDGRKSRRNPAYTVDKINGDTKFSDLLNRPRSTLVVSHGRKDVGLVPQLSCMCREIQRSSTKMFKRQRIAPTRENIPEDLANREYAHGGSILIVTAGWEWNLESQFARLREIERGRFRIVVQYSSRTSSSISTAVLPP